MQQIKQPAPPRRPYVKRLTKNLRELPVDPETGLKLDINTARCLRAHGETKGWKIVQHKDGDHIIIWRIG